MSLLAHSEIASTNIWGFAYVGSVIGLFVSGLYFVQRRVARGANTEPAKGIASLGRLVVIIGAAAGALVGLGIGIVVDTVKTDSHATAHAKVETVASEAPENLS